jgi:hypothetical protein
MKNTLEKGLIRDDSNPTWRVYQMHVHDNKADDFVMCNPDEKKELKNRDELRDFFQDNSFYQELLEALKDYIKSQIEV